jgi:hypothetical protein
MPGFCAAVMKDAGGAARYRTIQQWQIVSATPLDARMVRQTRQLAPFADGCPINPRSQTTAYQYDPDGNAVGEDTDEGCDGRLDLRTIRRFVGGLLAREETRVGYDLAVNPGQLQSHDYEYDASGRIVRSKFDIDDPWVPIHEVTTTEYDGPRMSRESKDRTGDAQPEEITTYEYESSGGRPGANLDRVSRIDFIDRSNEQPDTTTRLRYDDQGREIEALTTYVLGGQVARTETWTYEDAGNGTTRTTHREVEGAPAPPEDGTDPTTDIVVVHTSRGESVLEDSFGNALEKRDDDDGDGVFEDITTYDYSCFGAATVH